MEKILLAVDAVNPNPHSLDFACFLGRLTHSEITAVFLENLVANEKMVVREAYGKSYVDWMIDETSVEYRHKRETIEKNICLFKDSCEKRSVRYTIRRANGDPAKEIIRESRYADVLLTDGETSFTANYESVPTEFAKSVLKDAECPVIIAPTSFDGIDELVFTYNGSKSAMWAIKQFAYLFPQLDEKKVTIIEVDNRDSGPDKEVTGKFREWVSAHYSSIGFETLEGDVETELFASLYKKKNVFIVMGAYGRSTLSQFFKHSRADLLIKTITQAFFITHN